MQYNGEKHFPFKFQNLQTADDTLFFILASSLTDIHYTVQLYQIYRLQIDGGTMVGNQIFIWRNLQQRLRQQTSSGICTDQLLHKSYPEQSRPIAQF